MAWTREKLIKEYLEFFKSKKHAIIANSSLIPENDPTVLFTTAGMHPLVPFLLGQKHPQGKRLANVQKCIRTGDIDEVGDAFHHTFFEMLGNWSLGDYFKKEAIEYSFEFLTKHLKIKKEKLTVTCFAGDKDAPKDEEASKIWQSLGIKKIKFLGKDDNWWGPAGKTGPCGPDTEMFVNGFEIWNDVFMQYNKNENGTYTELKQKNVDTGMGVERTLAILNNLYDDYLTECFLPIIKQIEKLSGKKYGKEEGQTRSMRIIADHLKAATFILAENISPSNMEQGYVLRKLIRRAIRYGKELGIKNFTKQIAEIVIEIYNDYKHLNKNKEFILNELKKEEGNYEKVLKEGIRKAEKIFNQKTPIRKDKFVKLMQLAEKTDILHGTFEKMRRGEKHEIKKVGISEKEVDEALITGKDAFLLYQSYGFPIEMIIELAREKDLLVSVGDFKEEMEKHQELSRTATAGRFKSGLADKSEETTKLHTATHLLLAALKQVLKQNIEQRGSNITAERLRFDFNFDRKLTEKEIKEAEEIVNKNIKANLNVKREELSLEQAKKSGATGIFEHKYGDKVSVYTICDAKSTISKEICAGPHATNTSQLGHFKIVKEESSAKGIRRIKAILT